MNTLLSQPHLSVVAKSDDPDLQAIAARIENKAFVDGRHELERLFGELLALDVPPTPKTLDLIGHSTSSKSLLVLGDWVIDAANPTVVSFFRGLAEEKVFPRLGINAVRLLGCLTADSGHGRWTLFALSEILGVEVYGTKDLTFVAHYGSAGFEHDRRYLLVSASELRSSELDQPQRTNGEPYARVLDLDGLPATALEGVTHSWPTRLASRDDASAMLRLVRRRAGATMPGLLTAPSCELALPSSLPSLYHRLQVLLDGELVRVYPDGPGAGIIYPVEDASALMQLVERMPLAHSTSTHLAPTSK